MEEHTLIVMMGCSGTGKSTLAAKICDMKPDCVIVSRDQIRFKTLKEGEDYFAHEEEVVKTFYRRISENLKNHRYVIADATHITPSSRQNLFRKITIPRKTKITGIWIETPIDTAIKRNNQRTGICRLKPVVIENQYRRKESPTEKEPFDDIIYISEHVDLAISRQHSQISSVLEKIANI